MSLIQPGSQLRRTRTHLHRTRTHLHSRAAGSGSCCLLVPPEGGSVSRRDPRCAPLCRVGPPCLCEPDLSCPCARPGSAVASAGSGSGYSKPASCTPLLQCSSGDHSDKQQSNNVKRYNHCISSCHGTSFRKRLWIKFLVQFYTGRVCMFSLFRSIPPKKRFLFCVFKVCHVMAVRCPASLPMPPGIHCRLSAAQHWITSCQK